MEGWRLADLFCGVGGFRAGLEPLGVKCVYSCDIDPTARKWYHAFFGDEPQGQDIRKVDRLPPHEILCAGFPCVAFSRAGQKRGRGDERGRLFDEVVRLLRGSPGTRAVLLENVPRILTAEGGAMHRHIVASLGGLGFAVHYRVMNAGHHGAPQQRRRCFYLALRHLPAARLFAWPAPHPDRGPVLRDILLPAAEGKYFDKGDITCAEAPREGDTPRRYPTPAAALPRYSRAQQMGYIGRNLQGQRIYHPHGLSPTLETWHPVRVWVDRTRLRVLRPREFARLMGFPDRLPVPEHEEEANKIFGNSVAVPLVTEIGRSLARALEAAGSPHHHALSKGP